MPVPEDNGEDVDFGEPSELNVGGISQARWDRAREECDVRDVVDILHDRRGNPCSCPFHGRDSKPSFYFFPQNNSCFCFGCPDGDGAWDPIKIVARSLDVSNTKALMWLEKEFKLPPLANDTSTEEPTVDLGEDPEGETEVEEAPLLATVEDLRGAFITHAAHQIQQAPPSEAVAVAKDILETYFLADKHEDPIPLARALGPEIVTAIVLRKRLQ